MALKKPGKIKPSKPSRRPSTKSSGSARQPVRSRAVPGTIAVYARRAGPRKSILPLAWATAYPQSTPLGMATAERDDRLAISLILAPFLIVALSLGAERSIQQLLAHWPAMITASQPPETRPDPLPLVERDVTRNATAIEDTSQTGPRLSTEPALIVVPPQPPLAELALIVEPPQPQLAELALIVEPPQPQLAELELIVEPPQPPLAELALIVEPPQPPLAELELIVEPPQPPLAELALLDIPRTEPLVCVANDEFAVSTRVSRTPLPLDRDAPGFGLALAAAAREQIGGLVIYNAKYARIAYPMGDVPAMFGVCTDVVVRAYRALGIDLQALVHETRSGTGDRNIDHRRVEVLRRFLARHGQALPISNLAEDYQPGDIVTYHRPQNRASTGHIAIVTEQLAPSGRPMIVHNRGWGPELEDALFVDRITGHFRFRGLADRGTGKSRDRDRLARN
jgi:uncharacterized protein YijF (DUF1287 family)